MKCALLYPWWKNEQWSSNTALQSEMESRGWECTLYNTYHNNGEIIPGRNTREYSNESLNRLHQEYAAGYKPDAIILFDYGVYYATHLTKSLFPDSILIAELGDCPQSFRNHSPKFGQFHGYLTPDWQCSEILNFNKFNTLFSTHCADHRIFYPRPEIQETYKCITTCGSRGNGLTEEIKKELREDFNNERYFYGEEHAKRLCLGSIVFQKSQFGEITRRIFEGMACGKMVLADRLPTYTKLTELFIEDEEIILYDTAKEAIDKIRYYSNHDSERLAIAKAGYKKVMELHTTRNRVDDIERLIFQCKDQLTACSKS